VVNTVSCHGTEVTVLTGCGIEQAATGLDAVTEKNHYPFWKLQSCHPGCHHSAASYSSPLLKDMKN